MGNFLSVLSGFTKGAADTFTSQAKEARDKQDKNDELLARTLLDKASDPELTASEADQHVRMAGKLLKMDKNTIENMSDAAGYLRAGHDDEMKQKAKQPKTTPPSLGDVPTSSASPTIPMAGTPPPMDKSPVASASQPSPQTPQTPPPGPSSPAPVYVNPNTPNPKGMVQPGNTDLSQLPVINNGDGSYSTVYSTSFEDEKPNSPTYGKEVLVKGILNGKKTDDIDALKEEYYKTGKHLGVFDSGENADPYAQQLHNDWEQGKIPGVKMRQTDSPASSGLGDIPSPPRTLGEMRFDQTRAQNQLAEQDKSDIELKRQATLNTIQREAQRQMASGELQDKIDLFKQHTGKEPDENEIRQLLGMSPKAALPGVVANFTMKGDALKQKLVEQGQPDKAAGIDDNKYYRPSLGADRKTITDTYAITSPSISSKAVQMDADTAAKFENDKSGRPLIPGQMYVPVHSQIGGDVQGFIPETELGSVSAHPDIKVVTDADGAQRLVITPTQTVTQRTAAGAAIPAPPPTTAPGQGGPFGSVPSLPVRPQAQSQSSGSYAGAGPTSQRDLNAYKPLNKTEFDAYNAAKEGLAKTEAMKKMLGDDPNLIFKAAIPGTMGARTYNRFKQETADIITRLRTGAALNENEQKFYNSQLPGIGDAVSAKLFHEPGAIQDALNLHESLYQRVVNQYQDRVAHTKGGLGAVPTNSNPGRGGNPKAKPSLDDIFGGTK